MSGENSAPMVPQFSCVRKPQREVSEGRCKAKHNQPCWGVTRTTSCPQLVMPKLANTRSATLPIPPICPGRRAREREVSL